MPRYRLKYAKGGMARYLSHLELIRVFHRAFRRAGLPQRFTEGFNPHQKLSFGPPLPVGVAGREEYLDLELEREMPPQETLSSVSRQLPPGMTVTEVAPLAAQSPGLGKVIDSGWYHYQIRGDISPRGLAGLIDDISRAEPWPYRRERDGKEFNLQEGIIGGGLSGDTAIDLLVRLGKGEVPLKGLAALISQRAGAGAPLVVTRYGLYQRRGATLIDPMGRTHGLGEKFDLPPRGKSPAAI